LWFVVTPAAKLRPPLRLLVFGSVPVVMIGVGTVGYHLIERWSWFDAFYMTVTTLTSIGYEISPLTTEGRTFTIVLALGGIFTVALAATEILRTIVTGELRDYWGKRRMQKRIEDLEQHVIVCGYGRVGRHVCADLLSAGISFVVIDRKESELAAAGEAGAHPVSGDATTDAILRRAGIARARALIAVAGTDSDNVLITMSARLLHPTLPIVARAEEESTTPKLLRAGATKTVSPYAVGGGRMAQAVLHPNVLDFIDVATRNDLPDVRLEEQLVRPGHALDGQTIAASGLRSRMGLILVAIKHTDGQMAFNPGDEDALVAGDTLIVLGRRAQLDRAELAMSEPPPQGAR
jgi:voltage-gated potassium channel